jgi:DNA-directed RNA polymerase subunit RPC12/RpoP
MAQSVCYLCRADAQSSKEFDPESRSLVTTVDCPRCGHYRLTPHAWTKHERACLAAYVQHENQVRRGPPLIGAANWGTLVRLGEALLERR